MDEFYLECNKLKKADLHLHLNGLFNTEVIRQVLKDENTFIPPSFNINHDLNVLNPKQNLINYLRPWDVYD